MSMSVSPQDVLAVLGRLEFEAEWMLEELEHGIRRVGIDDPHRMGLRFDLIWMGHDEIVATFGQGTVVDLPSDMSIHDIRGLLIEVMGQPSCEQWSRSRNVLEIGAHPGGRRFVSSKGLFAWTQRTSSSRSYMPYSRTSNENASDDG
jgi:hypothetical protein